MKKEDFIKNIVSNCDPDMSDEALNFYEKFFSEFFKGEKINPYYRGDCMISLGWTFGAQNKEGKFTPARTYTRLFTKEDIQLFYHFREIYHSKANFIVLPYGLNIWRGQFRDGDNDNYGTGSCDYFDILLGLIRKYFLNENMNKRMQSYVIPYCEWLDLYGKGEEGWEKFIKKNYLEPFVNENYVVKDIFASADDYQDQKSTAILGVFHDFDWCLPRCSKNDEEITLKTAKERTVNFMKNSMWIWQERAILLSKNVA